MTKTKQTRRASRSKYPKPQFDCELNPWTNTFAIPFDSTHSEEIRKIVTEEGLMQVKAAAASYRQLLDWENKQPKDSELRAMLLYCKKTVEPLRELLLHPNNKGRKCIDETTRDHLASKMALTYPTGDSWFDIEKRLKQDLQKFWVSCELLLSEDFASLKKSAPINAADRQFIGRLAEIFQTKTKGALSPKPSSKFFKLVKRCFRAIGDARVDKTYSSIIQNWLEDRAKSENKSRRKPGLIQS